jgi:hypothetical protein
MSKRFDIASPRKGKDGKTYWTRIGTAFEGDKGIQLIFDALPLPDAEGRCVANLFEPRERRGAAPATDSRSRRRFCPVLMRGRPSKRNGGISPCL